MELKNVDFIVAVDKSASMQGKSVRNGSISRFKEVEEMALGIASEAAQFDADGIDVIAFGVGATLHKGVTPNKVAEVFAGGCFDRGTDTHEMVRVAAARQKETGKPTIVIVFTDGAASEQELTARAIVAATKELNADEDLTFGFVQVGDDQDATAFLTFLDNELKARGAKFDIVDTITAAVAAKMSVPEMMAKFVQD